MGCNYSFIFNAASIKPTSKLDHGWVIASHFCFDVITYPYRKSDGHLVNLCWYKGSHIFVWLQWGPNNPVSAFQMHDVLNILCSSVDDLNNSKRMKCSTNPFDNRTDFLFNSFNYRENIKARHYWRFDVTDGILSQTTTDGESISLIESTRTTSMEDVDTWKNKEYLRSKEKAKKLHDVSKHA